MVQSYVGRLCSLHSPTNTSKGYLPQRPLLGKEREHQIIVTASRSPNN